MEPQTDLILNPLLVKLRSWILSTCIRCIHFQPSLQNQATFSWFCWWISEIPIPTHRLDVYKNIVNHGIFNNLSLKSVSWSRKNLPPSSWLNFQGLSSLPVPGGQPGPRQQGGVPPAVGGTEPKWDTEPNTGSPVSASQRLSYLVGEKPRESSDLLWVNQDFSGW